MDGFDALDKMRADPRTRHVPVVILSNKLLSLDDVKRLEQHALVTLQSKGILSEVESVATLNRALFGFRHPASANRRACQARSGLSASKTMRAPSRVGKLRKP